MWFRPVRAASRYYIFERVIPREQKQARPILQGLTHSDSREKLAHTKHRDLRLRIAFFEELALKHLETRNCLGAVGYLVDLRWRQFYFVDLLLSAILDRDKALHVGQPHRFSKTLLTFRLVSRVLPRRATQASSKAPPCTLTVAALWSLSSTNPNASVMRPISLRLLPCVIAVLRFSVSCGRHAIMQPRGCGMSTLVRPGETMKERMAEGFAHSLRVSDAKLNGRLLQGGEISAGGRR